MKVAVLIPLHNHVRHIAAAVTSLRAQSRPPDRIIIVDDGSTDGSLNGLMTIAEEPDPALSPIAAMVAQSLDAERGARIETRTEIVIQPHAGAHAALNHALSLADDCDYLAVLDADDCYHPRRIERCLAYLEEHPGTDLVCTRMRLIDDQGDTLPTDAPRARWFAAAWSYHAGYDGDAAPDLAEWLGLADFVGPTSNFFARASYLRAHPFQDYRRAYHQHALVLAALEDRLGVLDAELLDYRIHPDSRTSDEREHLVREMLLIHLGLARHLAGRLGNEPALRAAFARYQRALWSNVSATRADLLNLLLCQGFALLPEGITPRLLAQLDRGQQPEVAELPNRAIVNTHQPGVIALGPGGGLADKFYKLKAQLSDVRADARPWMEYRQLQEALLDSRWFALGRLLGRARAIVQPGGKTAPEKLTLLRERIAASRWLRLGRRLGVGSARRLLDLCRSSAQID